MSRVRTSFIVVSCFVIVLLLQRCKEDSVGDPIQPGPPWINYSRTSTGDGLISDTINSIFIDANSTKWFGTDQGISGFRRTTWISFSKEIEYSFDTLVLRRALTIAADLQGSLWIGTGGGGIRRNTLLGTSEQWLSYVDSNGVAPNYVSGTQRDLHDDMWFSTSAGVKKFHHSGGPEEGLWTLYEPSPTTYTTAYFTAINIEPSTGIIWCGNLFGDIVRFDGISQWIVYPTPHHASPITSIAFESVPSSSTPLVWIGTDDGVFRFSLVQGWTEYTTASTGGGLPSNHVRAIVIDATGPKWFGTEKGLAKFQNNQWKTYNRTNSPLPSNIVTALALDSRHNLWIGTLAGVAVFNEEGTK